MLKGDVLRTSLLTRYFGKSFIQKRDNVELGVASQRSLVTHGPGGQYALYASLALYWITYIASVIGRPPHDFLVILQGV